MKRLVSLGVLVAVPTAALGLTLALGCGETTDLGGVATGVAIGVETSALDASADTDPPDVSDPLDTGAPLLDVGVPPFDGEPPLPDGDPPVAVDDAGI